MSDQIEIMPIAFMPVEAFKEAFESTYKKFKDIHENTILTLISIVKYQYPEIPECDISSFIQSIINYDTSIRFSGMSGIRNDVDYLNNHITKLHHLMSSKIAYHTELIEVIDRR